MLYYNHRKEINKSEGDGTMKKYMYDLKNKDTGKIEKTDLIAEAEDLTEEAVEFFFGGVDFDAVNVREVK